MTIVETILVVAAVCLGIVIGISATLALGYWAVSRVIGEHMW